MTRLLRVLSSAAFGLTLLAVTACQEGDALPSWHDGATKQAIVEFVEGVTAVGGPEFVPAAERIAVFDNDGTLWSEQPIYVQLAFALDRVRALAPQHPEWREEQPFKGVLEDDMASVLAGGEHGLLELVMATHAGMTTDEFARIAMDWLESAEHPQSGRRYIDMVYQPMLELLDYLRDNDFKTYVVSGGGIEFMRPWTERVYGIPPEQVVGSSIVTKFEMREGVPVLVREPEMNFLDDKDGKPVAINQHIGRRPIAAFGNSDGDLQMLQWAAAGSGPRFTLIVHHTDGEREWAYDRESAVGRLDWALNEAREKGWTVVDMERDWKVVYPVK
jgi:phosphoserine phosphatase